MPLLPPNFFLPIAGPKEKGLGTRLTFDNLCRDEYERKDPNVDPLKAEIEIIREEHRKPRCTRVVLDAHFDQYLCCKRHGLDVIEKTELEKLEKEGERKKSQEGHVKFSVSPDVYKTYGRYRNPDGN